MLTRGRCMYEVALSHNSFTLLSQSHLEGFLKCSHIRQLCLAHCRLTSVIVCDAFSNVQNLQDVVELDLSYNPLLCEQHGVSVWLPCVLAKASALEVLTINGIHEEPRGSAQGPLQIPTTPSLQGTTARNLSIRMCNVDTELEMWENILSGLLGMPLKALDLKGSTVKHAWVELWELNAFGAMLTGLTGAGVASLEFGDFGRSHAVRSSNTGNSSCSLANSLTHSDCSLSSLSLRSGGVTPPIASQVPSLLKRIEKCVVIV